MKNQQILFAILCLFLFRLIVFSGTYVDSICILALLAYKLGSKLLELKNIQSEVLVKVETLEQNSAARLQELSNEVIKLRNNNEGIKAAINLTAKR
jgi:hypothetical protein